MPGIDQLSEGQITLIRQLFNAIDANGDGHVTPAELSATVTASGLHMTTEALARLLGRIDGDHSGTVEWNEFLDYVASDFGEAAFRWFQLIDRDGDGRITSADCKSTLAMLGRDDSPAEVERLMHEADLDDDGAVNYDDFFRFLFIPR